MAKPTSDAGLWLPPQFLADNDDLDAAFGFPSEFPYEFGLSSPAVESVAGSTETESSDEEEDFFAGLTRRLIHSEWNRKLVRSQRRSGDGSPNGNSRVPSPSTVAPFADPWEVLYEAAGQVARLKMNSQVHWVSLLNSPRCSTASETEATRVCSVWGRQAKPNWMAQNSGKCNNRPLSLPQTTWSPLQFQHQNQQRVPFGGSGSRVVLLGGSSVKKGCGGTGVFLPRHYDPPSEPRKKTGCAPVLIPAKVARSLNLNFDDLNAANLPRSPMPLPRLCQKKRSSHAAAEIKCTARRCSQL
ncbi:hypothetical protein SESBI_13128 [Sesbania bispinosa]|nr:hypothetical protein SESBI_13128 [Sesbania bispinosa]